MQSLETWELVVLGAGLVLLLFWFWPGVKALQRRSQDAPRDWPGLLVPIGLVVLFVIILIALV
ncbi:MAG: hypothetical protein OEQ39_05080 [Gammaproteobacteria bacterium]|nr:hypothetical protein [Gammaproteobacteria bacterium]MDH3464419.1 hypothetical protein [Gammaproteobacteria bacterium]